MNKLNIFEKLVFGLAMLLLAVVAITEIFPGLWTVLPSKVTEAVFSGTDIAMIGLTFGVVFFAGTQAFLQWRHHRFEREIERNKWKLALHGPRAEFYKFSFKSLGHIRNMKESEPEFIKDFNNLMLENQHYLPEEVKEYVSEIYYALKDINRHKFYAVRAEGYFRANPKASPKQRKRYEKAVSRISEIEEWHDKQDGTQTLRTHFDKILKIPENL